MFVSAERSCERKQIYKTEEIAIKKASSASFRTGHVIEHYYCIYCGYWHIGHASMERMKELGYEVAEEFGKPERK